VEILIKKLFMSMIKVILMRPLLEVSIYIGYAHFRLLNPGGEQKGHFSVWAQTRLILEAYIGVYLPH